MPTEYFRVAERGVDGDVFLERDLALHEALPVGAASCNGAPSIVSTARNKKAALVGGFLSGGARRDRTADLLHAMQALSQLSYGPNPFVCRGGNARSVRRPASRRTSCLFFLLDGLADDVGHIGIAFFLFLDKCGVVGTGFDLDFLNLAGRACRRLLALLLGLGILKRNEFGIGGLGHDL